MLSLRCPALVIGILAGFHAAMQAHSQVAPEEISAQTVYMMQEQHVPGVAVGVEVNGRVLLATGFGVRDVGTNAPVDADTAFGIASLTKAFTTSVMAMLVDEGKLDWDKPVHTYLPWFRMSDPLAAEEVTLKDLASHRTGMPRHDAMWRYKKESREELVRSIQYLEPNHKFRDVFQYSNLMYVVAGYLAGQAEGCSWEDLVQRRLLEPLQMTHTTTSLAEMEKGGDFALPHIFKNGQVIKVVPTPFQSFGMGPNGAINSSVTDMLQFLRFQLSEGKDAEDRQIVSAEQMRLLHSPISVVPASDGKAPSAYALGWFVEQWCGHQVLSHPGGIGGYTSYMLIVPDRQIGIVVLDNRDSFLPWALGEWIADKLLGIDPGDLVAENEAIEAHKQKAVQRANARIANDRDSEKESTRPLREYAGTYQHPAYGKVSIEVAGTGLVVKFNAASISLEHYRSDTFQYKESFPAFQYEDPPVRLAEFRLKDGVVSEMLLPLETAVRPLVFERLSEKN